MAALWLVCHGRLVAIKPVVLAVLPNLEGLLGMVSGLAEKRGGFEPLYESDRLVVLDLCQAIADLHPRFDKPGSMGFPVWGLEVEELERLFFGGAIVELNQAKPIPSKGSDRPDPFPPFACESVVDSYVADLTVALESYPAAIQFVQSHDINAVSQILQRLGDLKAGPQAREERELKDWFWKELETFDFEFEKEGD